MAVAPQAIKDLFADVKKAIPQAVLSGIVGDVHHGFGYHLARNQLPSDDYSVELKLDKQGSASNASALDISLNPALMIIVTSRLLAAAKAKDPRLAALREFCGTTDGKHTHPYDLSNRQDGPLDSWDDSHLWHVHLSFYRAYADNYAALAPIADVIAGTTEDDMPTPADVVAALMAYKMKGQDGKLYTFEVFTQATNATSHDAKALADAANQRCAAIQAELDAIKTQLATSGTGTPAPSTLNITGGTLTIGAVKK